MGRPHGIPLLAIAISTWSFSYSCEHGSVTFAVEELAEGKFNPAQRFPSEGVGDHQELAILAAAYLISPYSAYINWKKSSTIDGGELATGRKVSSMA